MVIFCVRVSVEQRAADDVRGVHGAHEFFGFCSLFPAARVDLHDQRPEHAAVTHIAFWGSQNDVRAWTHAEHPNTELEKLFWTYFSLHLWSDHFLDSICPLQLDLPKRQPSNGLIFIKKKKKTPTSKIASRKSHRAAMDAFGTEFGENLRPLDEFVERAAAACQAMMCSRTVAWVVPENSTRSSGALAECALLQALCELKKLKALLSS